MKGARKELERAAQVKAAVDEILLKRTYFMHVGRRIEEVLRTPIAHYPDEIMSLDLLPTMDNFKFIGWTADFEPVICRQDLVGKQLIIDASVPLVGWKPIRSAPLTGSIK